MRARCGVNALQLRESATGVAVDAAPTRVTARGRLTTPWGRPSVRSEDAEQLHFRVLQRARKRWRLLRELDGVVSRHELHVITLGSNKGSGATRAGAAQGAAMPTLLRVSRHALARRGGQPWTVLRSSDDTRWRGAGAALGTPLHAFWLHVGAAGTGRCEASCSEDSVTSQLKSRCGSLAA